MSKKQWGHGYYQGLKDAKDYIGVKKYLVCIGDSGHILCVYRVLKKVENIFTVENISDCFGLIAAQSNSYGIPDENDIDFHNVDERTEEELTSGYLMARWFSSEEGCISFCIKDLEKWYEEKRAEVLRRY